MNENIQVGSKLATIYCNRVYSAIVERETACYWFLDNGFRFKKSDGHYYDKRGRYFAVSLWDDASERKFQAQDLERQKVAKLSEIKHNLVNYISYMQVGCFQYLSDTQIEALEEHCRNVIGPIKNR